MSVTTTTSVLFTDLVDSTATASRLGPDRSEELRSTHFSLLREAIAATGGTEVKNLGDGLMVVFASPSRALACAVAMQQAVDRHNRRAPEPLRIRVGLSVGEAVEEDGDYFGEPVVEAARLCAACSGGKILTTEIVRAIAGRRAQQTFIDIGPLSLKGLPEPVPTLEVLWERTDMKGRVPLPAPLVAATTNALFGFFGRATELEQLGTTQKLAFTEPRLQTALVAGEAGIGKTALIAQAAKRAHTSATTVLMGHCDEDLTVPYQPWIEALSHLVEHLGTGCLDTLTPLHRGALARLIPALGGQGTRGDDLDSERAVLMHAIQMLLAQASVDDPIVVVLDDLHWADTASLQVLRHLVASADAIPVLVLGAYRQTDLGAEHPLTALLADLHRQPGITRILLAGLDDASVVELIATAAGHDLDAAGVRLAHELRRETDGNPFFTGELLRHLTESGAVSQGDDGRWVARGEVGEIALPGSVREVVARRVLRLGPEAGRILSIASVIGRDFSLDVLARAAERTEDDVLDVLEVAAAAAVVTEPEATPWAFRFSHAIIQHTLYQDLGASRRGRTHQRVAEAIEALEHDDAARTAELARHWVAAIRPAETEKALRYVARAGDDALAALAPDDAMNWYRQGLDLVGRLLQPDDALRCRLLVGLGTAQRHIGGADHRATLLQAINLARAIEDTELLVAAILAADRGISGTSLTDNEWVIATEAALEAIGPDDSRPRARLLTVLSQVIDARDWRRRQALSAEAVAVARRLGDDATLLAILPVAYQDYGPEARERRLHETAEAVALADRLDDPIAGCTARLNRIDTCMQDADIDEVNQRLAELATLAESTALPLNLWQLQMTLSWRALLDGRCDDAEAAANEAFGIGVAGGHTEATLAFGLQLIEIRRHQGRLDEMVDLLKEAQTDDQAVAGLRQALASVYCELGRLDEARPLFAPDLATRFTEFPGDEMWLAIMILCATTAVALRDQDASRMLYEQLLPYERRVVAVYSIVCGAIARHLGCLATVTGRYPEAEAHLRVALEIHERIAAPYWIACTQLDLRDLLVESQAPEAEARARELGESAHSVARSRGYRGLEAR